jgi:hypothetical protein
MQFVEVHAVELSQRNFKCKCNIIIEVSFFSMFDDGYEIFVEMPSYMK